MKILEKKPQKLELKGIVRYVYKKMGKAIQDYNMLDGEDKVLIAVSGGISSLALLRLFHIRKQRIPLNFDILACFIETDQISLNKEILFDYFNLLEIDFVVKRINISETTNKFWCAPSCRDLLFQIAKENRCNKIALGHNLDDVIENTLFNFLFSGKIDTIKPKIEITEDEISIIRPLCYIEEKDILSLSSKLKLPSAQYKYIGNIDKRYLLVKEIIKKIEKECPFVKKNIFRAFKRIKKNYLL
jgi:tRNA 2-thiocytidine biosynthesis protein TtcA